MDGTHGRWLFLPLALVLAAALVACGGSATDGSGTAQPPTAAPAASTGTEPGAGATSAEPEPASVEPAPAGETPASGGGATAGGDVCDLVTAEDMAGVLGKSPVVQELFAGPPDTCDYQVDNAPLAAIVLMGAGEGAGFVYDAMKADPATEEFSGIGDRALYNAGTETFLVMKGDRLLTIAITDVDLAPEARLDAMKEVARIAAGRM